MMHTTLVVGAAPIPGHEAFYRDLLAAAGRVVAADAAGEWCVGLGRVPDLVIGDFDGSAPGATDRLRALGCSIETHPAAKDETDLELAVARALELWAGPITLTAAFSLRIDHTLAALGALLRGGTAASVCEPEWTAHLCVPGAELALDLPAGTQVSVIALAGACVVSVTGAEWSLDQATLQPLSGRGISNRALGGALVVKATEGNALVIVQNRPRGGLY